ncbi:MAG: ATP synthase F1 subunit delta [Candidatus Alkaliphilus sp. MAG34]
MGELVSRKYAKALSEAIPDEKKYDIKSIVEEYIELTGVGRRAVQAVVVTAVPLSSEMSTKLRETLSQTLGEDVQLRNKVDKEIIGGAFLKVGDKVVDRTIRSQLEEMRGQILKVKN